MKLIFFVILKFIREERRKALRCLFVFGRIVCWPCWRRIDSILIQWQRHSCIFIHKTYIFLIFVLDFYLYLHDTDTAAEARLILSSGLRRFFASHSLLTAATILDIHKYWNKYSIFQANTFSGRDWYYFVRRWCFFSDQLKVVKIDLVLVRQTKDVDFQFCGL